jgi:hypothetical protein
LAREFGIAAVGSLEICLSLFEVHSLSPFSTHCIVPFGVI